MSRMKPKRPTLNETIRANEKALRGLCMLGGKPMPEGFDTPAKEVKTRAPAKPPEYQVRVRSSIGDHTRHVCEVECVHPSKPSLYVMADTMTGSLYRDGVCLSGDLRFVGKPRKTGRAVPSWVVRQKQGQQIVALSNTVVTEVTDA